MHISRSQFKKERCQTHVELKVMEHMFERLKWQTETFLVYLLCVIKLVDRPGHVRYFSQKTLAEIFWELMYL
jgi:hypothetical protein